jgi:hypothetical protein
MSGPFFAQPQDIDFPQSAIFSECHYFSHKKFRLITHSFAETGADHRFKQEVIMHRGSVLHWKVEYKTANGAQGALTVRAGTLEDAKRITAEITRTDPNDVLDAYSVNVNERAPSPRYFRGRH